MDLPGDRGVVPFDGAAPAVLHIKGFDCGVGQIALGLLDLPNGVLPVLQITVHIHISVLVRGVLGHRIALGIRDEEGHTVDALAGDRVHLVNESGAGEPVGDLHRGGLAVFDLNVFGLGIQPVVLGGLGLLDSVPARLQVLQIDDALAVGAVEAQLFPIDPADGELHTLDGLAGLLVQLQDFQVTGGSGLVVEIEGLGVVGVDGHRLGCLVQHIAAGGLGLGDHHGAGLQPGDDDLALFVCGIEPFGADRAALGVHILAVRGGHSELRSLQGLLGVSVPLDDHQCALGLIAELQR